MCLWRKCSRLEWKIDRYDQKDIANGDDMTFLLSVLLSKTLFKRRKMFLFKTFERKIVYRLKNLWLQGGMINHDILRSVTKENILLSGSLTKEA